MLIGPDILIHELRYLSSHVFDETTSGHVRRDESRVGVEASHRPLTKSISDVDLHECESGEEIVRKMGFSQEDYGKLLRIPGIRVEREYQVMRTH